MQVSNPNNVKIYNLSAGKSLPEWLSERKRRALQKQDVDVRRRIQLLQDLEMPTVSSCVEATPDGQYLYVTGTYKPRMRCYDLNQMSMKFERCLDSDVVKLLMLSDDYTKPCLLQTDRFVEFHSQGGRYYRTRLPKYGRDMACHSASCDLYFVGVSSEIYRLNLEQGRFLNSLPSSASEIMCCQFNPVHQLFACGTKEGQVECWDPRSRTRVGVLDCALSKHVEDLELDTIPSITALKFRDGLSMAVGTSTGHVLQYDIRSSQPSLVKDHQYGLPITAIDFQDTQDLVLSMDSRILKMWNRHTGKAFTAVEPGTKLNDLCVFDNTGLLFMANEAPKVLSYYIPGLGTAPKWCAFLDNMTEELEETASSIVYDDYKFVTRRELEDLGLSHLIGSSLLRAYMHGFFMDMRLYNKAKSIADPFAYEEYRKSKVHEKMEQERSNRVQLRKKLPRVNRLLAEKLVDQDSTETKKGKKEPVGSLLKDDRFSAMFRNPDFQVDMQSDEYKLLNPVVSKLDKDRAKRMKKLPPGGQQFDQVEDDLSDNSPAEESSSDEDERTLKAELKKQHRLLRADRRMTDRELSDSTHSSKTKPKFFEIKEGAEFKSLKDRNKKSKVMKRSLAERLETEASAGDIRQSGNSIGNKELTFSLKKEQKESRHLIESKKHHAERRKIRRSAADISKRFKDKPKFWMGKRVK